MTETTIDLGHPPKKVINVGYQAVVGQYDALPARWSGKVGTREIEFRMMRTDHPICTIIESKMESSLDLFLTGDVAQLQPQTAELLHISSNFRELKVVPATRPRKSTQAMMFEHIQNGRLKSKIPNFVCPKVWAGPMLGKSIYDVSKAMVMKVEDGSNGGGHILFSKENVQSGLIDEFEEKAHRSRRWSEIVEWLSKYDLTLTSHPNEDNEITATRMLNRRFLQEFVDVDSEFRILASKAVSPGDWLLQERKLATRDGYQQCTGFDGDMVSCKFGNSKNDRFMSIREEVITVITELLDLAPVLSIDVFTHCDSTNWGLFEFSNEFSLTHFNPNDRVEFLKNVILREAARII